MLQRDYAPKMNVSYAVLILFAYSLFPELAAVLRGHVRSRRDCGDEERTLRWWSPGLVVAVHERMKTLWSTKSGWTVMLQPAQHKQPPPPHPPPLFWQFKVLKLYLPSEGLSGLRLMKVVIPAYKLRGESAFLECQYELNRSTNDSGVNTSGSFYRSRSHPHQRYHHQQPSQTYRVYEEPKLRDHHNLYDSGEQPEEGEALYAVKWYKDNEEFYRYVPKANPPKQSYRVDGIRVVEEHSDSSRVLLRGLTLNSTGLYKCEVSAEAPNFSSVQGEGRMDIVYLPRDGPHIRGKEDQYQIGDTLNLNCTSGKSHPASHLQWFINKDAVHSSSLIRYNDTVHKHGLITSTLGLQLIVDARHFQDGVMRVKCLASISPVLWKGGKESVLQRRQGVIDNREAMLLVVNSSSYPSSRIYLLVVSTLILKLNQLVLSHIS